MNNVQSSALSGIKVVDLTSIIFGPYASLILADYGADVIKVESPAGDSTRNTGPSFENGLSAVFLSVNRNKRSICLDLKKPEALEALYKIIDTADVFMHSIRPQKMISLGLDPDTLLKRNPKLVYAALHGFGNGGKYSGDPAYDDTIQGLSGVADVMGRQTGTPRYLPTIAADKTCGLIAAHGILAAVIKRERTGQGQFVEIPMFEAMTSYMLVEHFYGHHLVGTEEPTGYQRVLSEWRKPYATKDSHVCMMPYTDVHWKKFFNAVNRPELAESEDFINIKARTKNIDKLYELVGTITPTKDTSYWLELCNKLEIPATPVNKLEDLEHDQHLSDVKFFNDVNDKNRTYRFTRNPVRIQSDNISPTMPPRLGEHTQQVLTEAGLNNEEINKLIGE